MIYFTFCTSNDWSPDVVRTKRRNRARWLTEVDVVAILKFSVED